MPLTNRSIYHFGEFHLEVGARLLARKGQRVPLGSKAFEVLTCLVRHPGEVVTKDQLLKTVWPNSFVEENNLTQHIFSLRKALGDRAAYIVTIPGRGYQFTGPVLEIVPAIPKPYMPEHMPEAEAIQTVAEPAPLVSEEITVPVVAAEVALADPAIVTAQVVSPAPRATSLVPRLRLWMMWWGLAVVVAVALLTWGVRRLRVSSPADHSLVVLADFSNTTGDGTFDRTLQRALEIELQQSSNIDVMSEREAMTTLQRMERRTDETMTPEVAREVCERGNGQAMLMGSIASMGREYLLTLEARDCRSGKDLAAAKSEAATKEKVLGALDTIADRVRTELSRSAKPAESSQVPLLQATTPSLEALKAYSMANYLEAQGKEPSETLPFYQRAKELDPGFAMAYVALGVDYSSMDEEELASANFRKAFELSEHVSAKEKLAIRAHYLEGAEKDLLEGIKAYQLWAANYPRDWEPWVSLANVYTRLGQSKPAIAAGEQGVKADSNRPAAYLAFTRAYQGAGRFADAKQTAEAAERRGRDSAGIHAALLEIAFAEQDQAGVAREVRWGDEHGRGWLFAELQGNIAASTGRFQEMRRLFQDAYEIARRDHLPEAADELLMQEAENELAGGLPAQARATLNRLDRQDGDLVEDAILRARMGDTAAAQQFLLAHEKDMGNTLMQYVQLPRTRAALAHGKPLQAIAALEPARPYELADHAVSTERAEAYMKAGEIAQAAEEYRRILANPGVGAPSVLYPLAHLGLARCEAAAGDRGGSLAEYQAFLTVWKDADADLPILKAAKSELARLQDNEAKLSR